MKKCKFLEGKGKCTPKQECYINLPDHKNCWNCYKYFIKGKKHTLYQCADLLGTSHTTIAQTERVALMKLKEILKGFEDNEKM